MPKKRKKSAKRKKTKVISTADVGYRINCEYTKLVSVNNLHPNPKNPNQHTQDQINRLGEIIEYSGWRKPIRVSKRTGFITAGHGALSAAKTMNWKHVPVDFQHYDSLEQEYADMVADNEIARWATTSLELVNAELPDLGPDLNIDLLGIQNFVLEPAEKNDGTEEKKKAKKETQCPECGHTW